MTEVQIQINRAKYESGISDWYDKVLKKMYKAMSVNINKEAGMSDVMKKVLDLRYKLEAADIDTEKLAIVLEESEERELRKDMYFKAGCTGIFDSPSRLNTVDGMQIKIVPDKPKEVPFTFETMPFPCVVRRNESPIAEFVVTRKGPTSVSFGGTSTTYGALADNWEWRCIGSLTWSPCRKVVG